MSWLDPIERRLQNIVEGAFTHLNDAPVHPSEIAYALRQELEQALASAVRGGPLPSRMRLRLHPADLDLPPATLQRLADELQSCVQQCGRGHNLSLRDVDVVWEPDSSQTRGAVDVETEYAPMDHSPPDPHILVCNAGPHAGAEIRVPPPGMTIGRAVDNDLILPDGLVSRQHAEIVARDGVFVLRDCDSANGTLVNDHPIDECELAPADVIIIGMSRFVVRVVRTA